jgi:NADH-ubiquinone oxidoreductase chain 2
MLLIGILIIILVIGLMPEKLPWSFFNRSVALMLLFSAILSYNTCEAGVINSGIAIYNGLWQITTMNTSMSTFIYIMGGLVLLLGEGPLSNKITDKRNILKPEYPLIIMLTTMGMISLIHSYDLITLFLAIELQSLSLYVLATIYKESESATSAGLKYFLLGGLSSSFILLGSSLLYGLTGMTNFETFYMISTFEYNSFYNLFVPALLILSVGLLFKIAAAPFHNWAPDVYDGVPTLVTSWLAVLPKISIIILMVEIFSNIFHQFYPIFLIFIISSFLSLILGSLLGLAQYRIKRLLAYSTISHVGFLLLALGTNTYQSIESLIFYIIQYSLVSLCIFYILIAFGYILPNTFSSRGSILTLSQLKGKLKHNTLLAWSLAICLFSMAGIPPCIGFFGKFLILLSTINGSENYNFMILVAIITSVIGTVYYLKLIKVVHFDLMPKYSDNSNIITNNELISIKESSQNLVFTNALTISILSIIIMFFILNPTPIMNLIHIISLTQIS